MSASCFSMSVLLSRGSTPPPGILPHLRSHASRRRRAATVAGRCRRQQRCPASEERSAWSGTAAPAPARTSLPTAGSTRSGPPTPRPAAAAAARGWARARHKRPRLAFAAGRVSIAGAAAASAAWE
jgi:hypothetical protein